MKEKQIDYIDLLKKSFNIVRHHKFLWFLGFLAGGSGFFNFGGNPNFDRFFQKKDGSAFAASRVAGGSGPRLEDVTIWMQNHWMIIAALAILVLTIIIFLIFLSVISRAGLVHSVNRFSKGEKSSLMDAWRFGWHKFWKVFLMEILLGLFALVFFGILGVLGFLTWHFIPVFILFIILAFLLAIFFFIMIGIIHEYAIRFIALKDKGTVDSLKEAKRLLFGKKKETALIWLVILGITMVSGLALFIGIVFAALILFLLGLVLYFVSKIVLVVYVIIAVITFFAVLFVAAGFISSFTSAYWTLAFKELESV